MGQQRNNRSIRIGRVANNCIGVYVYLLCCHIYSDPTMRPIYIEPFIKKFRNVCLSVCLSINLSIYLFLSFFLSFKHIEYGPVNELDINCWEEETFFCSSVLWAVLKNQRIQRWHPSIYPSVPVKILMPFLCTAPLQYVPKILFTRATIDCLITNKN